MHSVDSLDELSVYKHHMTTGDRQTLADYTNLGNKEGRATPAVEEYDA